MTIPVQKQAGPVLNQTGIKGAEFDVCIVGLGPIGITLANILGGYGLSVLAVDEAGEIYDLPRAIGMDHETMRVFQGVGLSDAVSDITSQYKPSEYRTASGTVIRRFDSQKAPFPLAWPPYMTFIQPDLERLLREKSSIYPNVNVKVSTKVTAITDIETTPVISIQNTITGKTETVRSRFVVGCDGGNSFIRQKIGIEFEDLIFDEPWLVIDMLINDGAVELPDVNVQYCDPRRPHTFFYGPQNLRRWEFMLMPGEDAELINQPDKVWELLSPWLNEQQATLWRSATYRFHALVAQQWRKGNVFLAGDACHMTPPFLAQGMVQGIKDTVNLGWKLAAVCKGESEKLLDSYEIERRPLVREVILKTKELGRIICELDPERAKIRNIEMRKDFLESQGPTDRQNLFPPIRGGITGRNAVGDASPSSGLPAPQPWIIEEGKRTRLDDLIPMGFHILAIDDFDISEIALNNAMSQDINIIKIGSKTSPKNIAQKTKYISQYREENTVFSDWLRKEGLVAILVRPDHLIFGGAKDNDQLEDLIRQHEGMISNNKIP